MIKRSIVVFSVLLFGVAVPLSAQQREIRGRVTSAVTGAPLPGANLVVVGTNQGTLTDAGGGFVLRVPAGPARLRASLIGFKGAEVTVPSGQSSVDFALQEDVLNLEGVVVTGQATTVARRNLANAVSTVTSAQLERAPSETVEKMVQGKVPGALIETNSGAPGGGVQVRLRGISSIIGANEPLYVVDGIVISNTAIPSNQNVVTEAAGGSNPSLTQDAVVNRVVDLNPNDIERIEVLKGASAAALYGSQAANGVILITTKRGDPGRPRFSLTQRAGTFQRSNELGFRRWTLSEAEDAFDPSLNVAQYFGADGLPLREYDHEDQLAGRSALSTETVLSVSGGDPDTRYFVSGTWKNDEGIIENTGFEKQGIRLNLEQEIGDRLTLTANTNVLHTLAARGLTNNDNSGTSFYMVMPFTPNFVDLSRQADGSFPENPFERSNPLQTAALMENGEDVWRVIAGGNASFDAIRTERQDLTFVAIAGADFFNQKNDLFFPPELQFEPQDGLPGTSLLSSSNDRVLTLNANAVHTLRGGGYTATSTLGAQYGDNDLSIARLIGRGLTGGQSNVDAGVLKDLAERRERLKTFGVFAQEELLLLDERLLLVAGLRADRASSNGDPDRYFLFPKAAASYRFDDLTSFLDGLKLRAAWGQSGNQPLYGQKFSPLEATNNIQGLAGLVIPLTQSDAITADPDLQPERQTEVEAGFDATLFGGNAQLEVTGFQKTVNDLLLQRTLAPTTGFATQIFNGGQLRVRGLEVAFDATPLRTRTLSWISRTTFYRDYSTITELPVPAFETGGFGTSLGAFRIEEGASATQIVANAGLDADGNTIVKKVGDATPSFRVGFSNDLAFGPFSLASLLDWSHGGAVINLTQFLADAGANSADFMTDPQPFTRRNGTVVQAGAGMRRLLTRGDFRDSRGYIEDGSYVKLRELSLSYVVPEAVLGRVAPGVASTRLTLSGRNLLTFTDYSGLDPEVSNFGNQSIARNIDVAPFPPSRSYWLALEVVF